jgi:hypothetical protein
VFDARTIVLGPYEVQRILKQRNPVNIFYFEVQIAGPQSTDGGNLLLGCKTMN